MTTHSLSKYDFEPISYLSRSKLPGTVPGTKCMLRYSWVPFPLVMPLRESLGFILHKVTYGHFVGTHLLLKYGNCL